MTTRRKRLWTCARCGHRFVTANLWHSCGRYRLAEHFRGKEPAVRRVFDRFAALIRREGPVTMYAQKTRIVFQARVRFAGATTRRRWLDVTLWLTRRARHPALTRTEAVAPGSYVHHFRLRQPGDVDTGLGVLVAEAAAVGRQEHLLRPRPRGSR